MAQTITRPQLVSPRAIQTLEAVRSVTGGGFDPDAWHVMDARDNELVSNEILHGAGSSTFVYDFEISGQAGLRSVSRWRTPPGGALSRPEAPPRRLDAEVR
jgi:hypothetical protein